MLIGNDAVEFINLSPRPSPVASIPIQSHEEFKLESNTPDDVFKIHNMSMQCSGNNSTAANNYKYK